MQKILHIQALELAYTTSEKSLLKNVNLEVNRGELVLLLGENGAGKSTLLRGLAGLQNYKSGEVEFKGKLLQTWNKNDLAKQMALVLTHQSMQGLLSVEEFVAFGRYPFTNWLGKLRDEDKEAIEESIQRCQLNDLRKKSINEVSDGEKQRVFLARALAQKAELLILDEPTTHLDVKHTTEQFRLLKKLVEEEGKTILFSSHQFDLALQIATKVWLIEGSKVHQITPEAFYEDCIYQEILLGGAYRYDKEQKRFRITL